LSAAVQSVSPPFFVPGGVEMSVIDFTSMFVVVGFLVVRFGVPILGMWLLGKGLQRLVPSMP
jgi:hypothetical protein